MERLRRRVQLRPQRLHLSKLTLHRPVGRTSFMCVHRVMDLPTLLLRRGALQSFRIVPKD